MPQEVYSTHFYHYYLSSTRAMIFSRPQALRGLPTRHRSGSAGLHFRINLPGCCSPPNQILARLDAASSLAPTADLIGCFSSLALTGSNATSSSRQQAATASEKKKRFLRHQKVSRRLGAAPLSIFFFFFFLY